jgi:hypothetical protein
VAETDAAGSDDHDPWSQEPKRHPALIPGNK